MIMKDSLVATYVSIGDYVNQLNDHFEIIDIFSINWIKG